MNSNSVIAKYIDTHPDNWVEMLDKEYGVKAHVDGPYAIFNYNIDCDFTKDIVQEARGIILDYELREVVCWPFRKFGNYNEGYVDTIDWNSARVLEKVDGSIVKLWYDKRGDKWQFSTNGVIRAENAPLHDPVLSCHFMDVIRRADNYNQIPFDSLNKDYTYIFELVSPETRVVVKYPQASLYHTGTRNNLTGQEYDLDIGIKKPASYTLKSLEDCVTAVLALNKDKENPNSIENEGFVVVDKDYHRIKIKSPDYLVMNKLSQIKSLSKKDCLTLLLNKSESIDVITERTPDLRVYFKFYEYKLAELRMLANKFVLLTKGLYREFDQNRGAVAKVISKHRLSGIGFCALDTDLTGEEIIDNLHIEKLLRLIPDYEPETFDSIFYKK